MITKLIAIALAFTVLGGTLAPSQGSKQQATSIATSMRRIWIAVPIIHLRSSVAAIRDRVSRTRARKLMAVDSARGNQRAAFGSPRLFSGLSPTLRQPLPSEARGKSLRVFRLAEQNTATLSLRCSHPGFCPC
jgi:hypothetical protein